VLKYIQTIMYARNIALVTLYVSVVSERGLHMASLTYNADI